MKKLAFVALIGCCVLAGCGSKPSEEKIKESIKKILPVELKIVSVKNLDYFPGLVEVVALIDNKPLVYYTDKKGDYIVSGSILKVDTKQNLTQEVMKANLPAGQATPPAQGPAKK